MTPFREAKIGDVIIFDDGGKHKITDIEVLPGVLISGPRNSKVTQGVRVYFEDVPPEDVSLAGMVRIERIYQ